MKRPIWAIVLLGAVTLGCTFLTPAVTPSAPPTLPAATSQGPTSAPPAAGPTRMAPANFDPALYRPAMLPGFAADVDTWGRAPRYSIGLSVNLDTMQATGHEQVHYTNTDAAPLSEIYFRLFPSAPGFGAAMTVTRVLLGGQAVTPQLEQQGTALKVPVVVAPGASADLALDFTVAIPRDPTVGYAMFGSTGDATTLPDFYPVIPVRDQSGWHIEVSPEYGDETFNPTALYEVSITTPAALVVAATGSCQTPQPGLLHCVSGPMRDFMVAMSPDYRVVTQTVDGTVVRSFYLAKDEKGGQRALQVGSDALRTYSRRFGAYPFAGLDVVETGTHAGGIEYPGLVVIAENLYGNIGPSSYLDFTIAHEVAHQWWYSLVGDDQVNHPWLDESLAQYSTILYYEDLYGKATADSLVNQLFEQPYQKLLQDKRDQKVDQPVAAFTESDYSTVVYRKGPLFFKALRDAVGDSKFDAFLKTYFRDNRYGIATPQRLLEAAESVADKATVRSLFDQWIESASTP